MYHSYDLIHDEIKKINFPEIARAGPLSPCVGLAIYDEISRSGYIVYSFGTQEDIIKKTLDLALNDFNDIKKLKVAVAGGGKAYRSGDKEIDDCSDQVSDDTWRDLENMINYYDFNKKKVRFYREKRLGVVQDLYLDCLKGRIVAESSEGEFPLDDLEIDYFGE